MTRKEGKMSIIIPARDGSSRCKDKNRRPFGDTNLLKKKVLQMKKIVEMGLADEVVVNTSSKIMIQMAKDLGVNYYERDSQFSTTDSTPSEVTTTIAKAVKNPIMIYVHCVAPFSKNEDLIEMIKIFRNNTENTSVASASLIKKQMWFEGKPLNCGQKLTKTQDLPDIYAPTYAFTIIETKLAAQCGSLFGNKPYFFMTDQISSIDIDTPLDFISAELLYKNRLETHEDLVQYLEKGA